MTEDDAVEIINKYNFFEDKGCTCFQGNPPCHYCENCIPEELYEEN